MGISHGKGPDMDDNAIIAVLLAQEVLIFEKFLEKPVGDDANGPGRQYRKVFSRPNYKESVWWRMLEKGFCKIPGTREYKLFCRRFGVGFERYKTFCEATRIWNTTKENDATGRAAVPLEPKVLGALRMVCKGCAFDAIASSVG